MERRRAAPSLFCLCVGYLVLQRGLFLGWQEVIECFPEKKKRRKGDEAKQQSFLHYYDLAKECLLFSPIYQAILDYYGIPPALVGVEKVDHDHGDQVAASSSKEAKPAG